MIKIKFHQNFDSDQVLYEKIKLMTPNQSGIWKNLQMVTDESYDFFIVLNHPTHSNFDIGKTIVFECETKSTRNSFPKFYDNKMNEFFCVYNTERHHNLDFWYHGLSYNELNDSNLFIKDSELSIINSNLNSLIGHQLRNNFISSLSNDGDFSLFGRHHSSLKQYKGALGKKADGLLRYKYTFNCENDFEPNYFTEKILDGIMCECLTFYDGCPNISDFIDERSFVKLDLKDIESSKELLKNSIRLSLYEDRKIYILEEKKRLMNDFNLLNITWKIINK